jgi:hypothetical protein
LKNDIIISSVISVLILALLFSGIFYFQGGLTGFAVSNIDVAEDADYKDGYIVDDTGVVQSPSTTGTTMNVGSLSVSSLSYRSFIDFNVPDAQVPDDATVNSVSVKLYIGDSNDDDTVYIYALSGKSTALSNEDLYAECGGTGSTLLVSASSAFNSLTDTQSATIDLGASAVTALSNQLANDWFSICIKSSDQADDDFKKFYSSNHGSYDPQLIVDYDEAASTNDAPTVSVSTSNETSFENTHTATVTYTPTDDTNLTLNCTLYFDSVLNQSQISTASSADTFTISGLDKGTYIYYVNCSEISENHDGLWNVSNELTFHINDTASPVITLLSPANGYNTTSTKNDLNFSVTDSFVSEVICNLTINGVYTDQITANTGTVYNFTRTLDSSAHYWNISCNDSSNNLGNSATRSFVIDSYAPTITVLLPENNTVNKTNHIINFTYTPADNLTKVSNCSLIVNEILNETNAGLTFEIDFNNAYYNWSINCTDIVGNVHSSGTYYINITDYDRDADGYNSTALGGVDCNDASASIYPGASCTRSGYTGSTYDSSCSCTGGTLTGSGTGGSSSGGDDTSDEATEEEPPAEEQDDTVNDEAEQETEDTQEEENTVQTRIDNWAAESGTTTSFTSVGSSVNITKNVTIKNNKTLIDLIVVPEQDMVNFSYYEDIPKCAIELIKAGYIDESVIKFHNPNFTIVDEDPLLMWQFDIVKAGEKLDLSYEISKEVLEDCLEKLENVGVTFGEISLNAELPSPLPESIGEAIKALAFNLANFFKEKTAAAIIGTIAGFMLLAFAGMQIKVRGSVEKKVKKELFGKKKCKAKTRRKR